MVTLDSIFDVWYGVNMEVVNSEVVVAGGIPFVSRQSTNNGVTCYVKPVDSVFPNPAHTLSIAVSGTVLSTFYHDYEYYSGRDIYVAKPKISLTKEEMLYYAFVIEANKYKYNYGRGANKTFRKIMIPAYEELPVYIRQYSADYQFEKLPIKDTQFILDVNTWHWFRLGDYLSAIYKATAYNFIELQECLSSHRNAIPYITRKDTNNGCKGYVINDDFEQIEERNAITIGDTTSTIDYQDKNFICGDHIVVLRSPHFNKYTALFVVTLLKRERFRYNYGRAFLKDTIANTNLKLPSILNPDDGTYTPDWQFMEDYIKSLPYSKNI